MIHKTIVTEKQWNGTRFCYADSPVECCTLPDPKGFYLVPGNPWENDLFVPRFSSFMSKN